MSGWRAGDDELSKPVDRKLRSHPRPSGVDETCTVTIIAAAVQKAEPGAAAKPTPGLRLTLAATTPISELIRRYARKVGRDVARLETLGGEAVDPARAGAGICTI